MINLYDKTCASGTGFETLLIRVCPNRCLINFLRSRLTPEKIFNPLNAELNPICH